MRRERRLRAVISTSLLGLLASGPAQAEQGLIPYAAAIPREAEGDSLTFGVFQVERYDSNFFRLQDDVAPGGDGRRGAFTSTSGAGLSYDKTYALQRFVVEAAVTRSLYSPYGSLDETGRRINSAYYWSVTPSLTGKLTINYTRIPTDYEFTGYLTGPNPRTTRLTRLDADLKPGATFHPRLSIYKTQDSSVDATFQQESSRATGGEVSLAYELRSQTTVAIYANRAKGKSLDVQSAAADQVGTDFTQSEAGFVASWTPTGLATVVSRIGYMKRDHQTFAVRNFSGWVGTLSTAYALTGKTRLLLTGGRALYGAQSTFSSFYAEDTGTASLEWSATGKWTIKPSFSVRRQQYGGAILAVQTPLREMVRYTNLQLDWAVLRSADVSFALSHSSRNATDPTLQFSNNSASVFARLKF